MILKTADTEVKIPLRFDSYYGFEDFSDDFEITDNNFKITKVVLRDEYVYLYCRHANISKEFVLGLNPGDVDVVRSEVIEKPVEFLIKVASFSSIDFRYIVGELYYEAFEGRQDLFYNFEGAVGWKYHDGRELYFVDLPTAYITLLKKEISRFFCDHYYITEKQDNRQVLRIFTPAGYNKFWKPDKIIKGNYEFVENVPLVEAKEFLLSDVYRQYFTRKRYWQMTELYERFTAIVRDNKLIAIDVPFSMYFDIPRTWRTFIQTIRIVYDPKREMDNLRFRLFVNAPFLFRICESEKILA
jgi:hypothetical protein